MITQLHLNIAGPPGQSVLIRSKDVCAHGFEEYITNRRAMNELYSRNKFTFEASIEHMKTLLGEPTYEKEDCLIDNGMYSVYEEFWLYSSRLALSEFTRFSHLGACDPMSSKVLDKFTHVIIGTKYTNLHNKDAKFPHKFFISLAPGFKSDLSEEDMLGSWKNYFSAHVPQILMNTWPWMKEGWRPLTNK